MAKLYNKYTGQEANVTADDFQSLGAANEAGYVPDWALKTGNITSQTITPSPSINYKTPEEVPVYPVANLGMTQMTLTEPEQEVSDLDKRIRDINDAIAGKPLYKNEQEKNYDIAGKTQTITDLTSQLNTIKNEAQAIPLQMQQDSTGRGITAGGLAPLQTARLRTNTIQALGVSSLLEAANGNLATAQTLVDKAVEQKFAPLEAERDAKLANLELIIKSPEYSLADKNRAMAVDSYIKQQATIKEKAKQDMKDIWSLAMEAAKNGADALTLQKIQNAPTPEEALRIATEAGVYKTNGEQFTLDRKSVV